MILSHGFWHNDSIVLSKNTTFKTCKYGNICAAFRNGSNSTMNCTRGSVGVMCSTCLEGFAKVGGGSCVPCIVEQGSASQVASVCALCIALIGFLLFMHGNAKHPQDTVGLPVKIFIDFSQMLSSLSIFSVIWSNDLLNLFDTASTANFGASLGSVTCITVPYHTSLIINIMSPFIIFTILASALVVIRIAGFSKEGLAFVLGRAVMVVLFLTYAGVASATMNFFHCERLGDDRTFLVSNYTLDCASEEYYSLMPWAIFGWLVTIFVPLLWGMGIMGMANHGRLRNHLKFTKSGKRGSIYRVAGSMYGAFRLPQGCGDIGIGWEAVRMIRKAGLIALAVFYSLPEYRSAQLCLGLVWLNIHIAIL